MEKFGHSQHCEKREQKVEIASRTSSITCYMYLRKLWILLFRTRETSSNFAAIVLALYGRKYVWCAIHGLLRGKELCVVRDLRNHFFARSRALCASA